MKSFFEKTLGSTPELITDERVSFNNPVTINSSTYYEGWVSELTVNSLLGASSATTGAYTAINKGGTRYTVISGGLPTSETVFIDFNSGRMLTNTATTLYITYYGYGRLYKWWELGGELRHQFSGLCDMPVDTTVYQEMLYHPERFVAAQLVSRTSLFTASFTIQVKNATSGALQNVTLSAGSEYGINTFTTALHFQKNDVLQFNILQNTSGVTDPVLILYRG